MAATNQERVNRALTQVRDGIRPKLEHVWQQAHGNDWINVINKLNRYPDREPSTDDLLFLLKGVWNCWHSTFQETFGPSERNYVSELRTARNRWAHNEQFSSDDTYRILDTAERLLRAFNAPVEMAAVRAAKHDLLRTLVAEEAGSEQRRSSTVSTKGEPATKFDQPRKSLPPLERRTEQASLQGIQEDDKTNELSKRIDIEDINDVESADDGTLTEIHQIASST
jgi:hypothetical protein